MSSQFALTFNTTALIYMHGQEISVEIFLEILLLNLTLSSFSRPYVRAKGRKFERARGRRASRGYKN